MGAWDGDVGHTNPINFTFRFSNSPFSFANAPNSVVPILQNSEQTLQLHQRRTILQIGVKSAFEIPRSMSVSIAEVGSSFAGEP